MILVTGGGGAVASYAVQTFGAKRVMLLNRADLDVTDKEAVFRAVEKSRPEAVLHLAAETNVDLCEKDPAHAFRVNETGTANVAKACAEFGAVMIYVSTAAVFDGNKSEPYTEDDPVSAQNVYGRSKLAGEERVAEAGGKFLIIRCGWMIGGGRVDTKFVTKILKVLNGGGPIKAVNDHSSAITYARELLMQIKELLESGETGVFHVVNPGNVTRFDMAKEIVSLIGSPAQVLAVGSEEFSLPAQRGNSEELANARLEALGMSRMSGWKEALKLYIKELEGQGLLRGGKFTEEVR